MTSETPAKGKRGFLLYSPFTGKHFFRIYESEDKRQFTDYRLSAEDIEVEILDDFTALYKDADDKKTRLDWSSKVLGKHEKSSDPCSNTARRSNDEHHSAGQ